MSDLEDRMACEHAEEDKLPTGVRMKTVKLKSH